MRSAQRVLLWNLDSATAEALTQALSRDGRFTVAAAPEEGRSFQPVEADVVICTAAAWAHAREAAEAARTGSGAAPAARDAEAGGPGPTRDAKHLTRREQEVLGLVAEGLTSRQIAGALQISLKTVQTHRAHLREKLGAHDRVDLVKMAICLGLATPERRHSRPGHRQYRSADR